jgi:hypothetical protein
MCHRPVLPAALALLMSVGCGDGTVSPGDGSGEEFAARFEQLADSVDGEGYSPTAEALRHAAEIVRLTGHATPVTLTVDGQDRAFLAVAEQLDFPSIECTWPGGSGGGAGGGAPGDSGVVGPAPPTPEPTPPDSGTAECVEVGTYSMRTLIAWEPEDMAEVVRLVADLGSSEVQPGVPDVMTGLPAGEAGGDGGSTPPEPGDTAGGGPGYPGFIGEYLVRDVGSWWAVEGSQANQLLGSAGACTSDRVTFDWAVFGCDAARFRFEFTMRVERMRYDPATGWDPGSGGEPGDAEEDHALALGTSEIAGVRLEVIEWVPPPLPPVDPIPTEPPVDSTGVSPDGTVPSS